MGKPKIIIDAGGPDGNIYAILWKVDDALRNEGAAAQQRCENPIDSMLTISNFRILRALVRKRVTAAESYKQAISIIEEYVTIEWKGGEHM